MLTWYFPCLRSSQPVSVLRVLSPCGAVEVTLVLRSHFPAGSSRAGYSRAQQHCGALVPVQAAALPATSSKGPCTDTRIRHIVPGKVIFLMKVASGAKYPCKVKNHWYGLLTDRCMGSCLLSLPGKISISPASQRPCPAGCSCWCITVGHSLWQDGRGTSTTSTCGRGTQDSGPPCSTRALQCLCPMWFVPWLSHGKVGWCNSRS